MTQQQGIHGTESTNLLIWARHGQLDVKRTKCPQPRAGQDKCSLRGKVQETLQKHLDFYYKLLGGGG